MDYEGISEVLGLDRRKDEEARDILGSFLGEFDSELIGSLIEDKGVVVFGCGPSLKHDYGKLSDHLDEFILVSVDGSARLFMEEDVVPDIHVTDLDGDLASTLWVNNLGAVTIVHAHGDNSGKVKDIVPKLSGIVFGTTQVEPTLKTKNFGGFTDGDRAVYLVEHFKPSEILLAGMDFGEEIGEYSGEYDPELKRIKLGIGKELLDKLIKKSSTQITGI